MLNYKPNRALAQMPAWYELREGTAIEEGALVNAGQNCSADFCSDARRLAALHGRYYTVKEVQHPDHDFPPFGFSYTT